jgi:hypothetical protein
VSEGQPALENDEVAAGDGDDNPDRSQRQWICGGRQQGLSALGWPKYDIRRFNLLHNFDHSSYSK